MLLLLPFALALPPDQALPLPAGWSAGVDLVGADLDGDGLAEIALPGRPPTTPTAVSTLLYAWDGVAAAPLRRVAGLSVLTSPGDLDGDGTDELVLADAANRRLIVAPGSPTGPSAARAYALALGRGEALSAAGIGDADGDGLPDLGVCVAETPQDPIRGPFYFHYAVFSGAGGGYAPRAGRVVQATALDVLGQAATRADVDGDGVQDLVLAIPNHSAPGLTLAGQILVVWGGARGVGPDVDTLDGPPSRECGRALVSLGDPDGDGDDDVLFDCGAGVGERELRHLEGGRGALSWSQWSGGTWRAPRLATGDFDGDGRVDLAIGDAGANLAGGAVSLHLAATPLGAPEAWRFDGAGGLGRAVALADVDGDGLDDLVAASLDGLSVWMGR